MDIQHCARHLGYIHPLAIVTNAAINTHGHIFEYLFSILSSVHLGTELLDHMVPVGIAFWGAVHCFLLPFPAHSMCIRPHYIYWPRLFSYSPMNFLFFCLFIPGMFSLHLLEY